MQNPRGRPISTTYWPRASWVPVLERLGIRRRKFYATRPQLSRVATFHRRVQAALRAGRDGVCSTSDAFEREDGAPGGALAQLNGGGCLLSPEGRLRAMFGYRSGTVCSGTTGGTVCTLELRGRLESGAAGFVGSGTFQVHDFIPGFFHMSGGWNAVQINRGADQCGNGIIEAGEDCELPGNLCRDFEDAAGAITPIQCAADCRCPATDRCGDGMLRVGEACDDGNRIDGDGCNARCLSECGGLVCASDQRCCPEASACRALVSVCPVTCGPVCGDGVCDGDENGCNCSADCSSGPVCMEREATCGNGRCERLFTPSESLERCPADCALDCVSCG